MQQVSSTVIQFRGSYYDFGKYQALQISKTNFMDSKRFLQARLESKFIVDIPYISSLLKKFAPGLLDELNGLANGLQLPLKTAFYYFGGFYANSISGCSIYTNPSFIVRNYDQEPSTYDGRYMLFQPENGIATIGPSMQILGRTDGMNEYGLAIGYNFVNSRMHGDGFVCNMIARIVLESCKTVAEAVQLLHEIPHKHAFNYCVIDASGQTAIVEASTRKVRVRNGISCTNHFHLLTEENRYTMQNSKDRTQLIDELSENASLIDAYSLLNDWDGGVFAKKYSAWDGTIHTAIYEPTKLQAYISFGANRMPVKFEFDKWLSGKDSPFKTLKGYLNSDRVFASQ